MIATLGEVKALLGITDTTYDTLIAAWLPIVEDDIIEYCNNSFIDQDISFTGDITQTVTGSVYTLDCADGGIVASHITSGDIIYLEGSDRNDGYYTTTALTDTKITVTEPIKAHAEAELTVYLVKFPTALQIYLSRMISYMIHHANDAGITSESIGNYSYARSVISDAGYPADVMCGLRKWRNIRCTYGSIIPHLRDRRGLSINLQTTDESL